MFLDKRHRLHKKMPVWDRTGRLGRHQTKDEDGLTVEVMIWVHLIPNLYIITPARKAN